MAWTTPVDQATGFLVTSAIYNAQIIDNLAYLHGDGGGVIDLGNGSYVNAKGFASNGPTSASYTGSQPGDGVFIDTTGVVASFCNAAVLAFQAGATTDSVPRWTVDSNGSVSWGTGGSSATDTTLKRNAAGQLIIGGSTTTVGNYLGGYNSSAPGLPATFTPNANAVMNRIAPINSSGTLTIAAPANAPSTSQGGFFFLNLHNGSAGAVTVSFNAVYDAPPAFPGTGIGRCDLWFWVPATSKWSWISGANINANM